MKPLGIQYLIHQQWTSETSDDLQWYHLEYTENLKSIKELRDQRLHVEIISRANSADLDYYRIARPRGRTNHTGISEGQ
jgi:hypothetical protein